MSRGLGITLVRGTVYSLIHYNTYRYVKDDIFNDVLKINSAFFPAFIAGFTAIFISQPLEVFRCIVSLKSTAAKSNRELATSYYRLHGSRALFLGFLPRLLRKPLNSGISWGILEYVKNS